MTRYQKDVLKRFGYSERKGCGEADAVPGLLAARPLLGRRSPQPRADRRAAEGRPRLLLARRHQRGPLDGDAGVRHPADVARASAGGHRRAAPAPEPAGGRAGRARRPARAGRRGQRPRSRLPGGGRRRCWPVSRRSRSCSSRAFRRWERALVPLVPIALATGWSALVLFALRIPLNPMSVTLGVLVIAISTEFSVLLSERYRAERAAGHPPEQALARTYRSTGAAVLASGVTAIAGLRRARRLGHPDAARLRLRHRRRPHRLAGWACSSSCPRSCCWPSSGRLASACRDGPGRAGRAATPAASPRRPRLAR